MSAPKVSSASTHTSTHTSVPAVHAHHHPVAAASSLTAAVESASSSSSSSSVNPADVAAGAIVPVVGKKAHRRRFDQYDSQIRALLKTHYPGIGMMSSTYEVLNGMINHLCTVLTDHCRFILTKFQSGAPKKTLQLKDVKTALRLTLPEPLSDTILAYVDKRVKLYEDAQSEHEKTKPPKKEKPVALDANGKPFPVIAKTKSGIKIKKSSRLGVKRPAAEAGLASSSADMAAPSNKKK